MVNMCYHIPWWRVGLLSFIEAEAFKMSPGRDTHAKLSAKKTVVLLKILYCRIAELTCSWLPTVLAWALVVLRWSCVNFAVDKNLCMVSPPNAGQENEGLLMWRIKWKSETHAAGREFVCDVHSNRWWNLDKSLWPRDSIPNHAVETHQFSKPSQIQGTGIFWQDNMHCVLGCWLTICLTNWQLQEFLMLTYCTNCLSPLKRSVKES